MTMKPIVPALSLLFLGACATTISLTGEGERVRSVTRADLPIGCNLLGDVAIGIPPDAARPRTEEQLVILMRNKAAQLGGTHVIVETKSQETGAGGEEHWRGRGLAYACEEEAGGGGSAGGEEPEGEAAPAEEGSDADEDPIVDDLLGD